MRYLSFLCWPVSVALTILCFQARKKRRTPEWDLTLTLPFSLTGISVFWHLFTLALAGFFLLNGWKAWPLVFLSQPLGWLLQLAYLNLWVRCDTGGFTQGALLGKTRSFRYEEITEICRGAYLDGKYASPGYEVLIYFGKAKVTISPGQRNYGDLLSLLAQKVPRERWKRADLDKPNPYNHNIANGWRQLVLSFLLPSIFAGLIVFEVALLHLGYNSKEDFTMVMWLFGSLGVLTLAWAILVLVVLRHPERHSPRLRRLAGKWVSAYRKVGMPPDEITDPLFPEEDVR